jgi:hypothetical protein
VALRRPLSWGSQARFRGAVVCACVWSRVCVCVVVCVCVTTAPHAQMTAQSRTRPCRRLSRRTRSACSWPQHHSHYTRCQLAPPHTSHTRTPTHTSTHTYTCTHTHTHTHTRTHARARAGVCRGVHRVDPAGRAADHRLAQQLAVGQGQRLLPPGAVEQVCQCTCCVLCVVCCAVCCAVLCCAVLRCAVLCCAVL